MAMRLRIKLKFDKHDRVTIGNGYVSNGHWAAMLEKVDNAAAFATLETARAVYSKHTVSNTNIEIFKTLPPTEQLLCWQATRWIYEAGKKQVRAFRCQDGRIAFFNIHYISMFECTELYGVDAMTMFCDNKDNPSVLIMPLKINDKLTLMPVVQPEVAAVA